MTRLSILLLGVSAAASGTMSAQVCEKCGGATATKTLVAVAPKPLAKTPDLSLTGASVTFLAA